ncbi:glycoside hydrolase family 16 protein [Aquidulcibacter paucihalophilus]|jgi:beta-glucanase (GH16 family)|nr:glycoside hydrolase family 16 protein [Aquidulcibacter paucihalophilus]
MKSAKRRPGFRSLLAAAVCLVAGAPAAAQDGSLEGYRLVWNDEFNVDGLPDPARWAYDTSRNREGWYNRELQYYSAARPENARVEAGRLIIEARLETPDPVTVTDSGGQDFTSARLISRGLAEWTYGFFEVRAKVPCGRGTWPAAWLLPVADVIWPAGGEIDILEHVGHDPGVVHGTVHTTRYNHTRGSQRGGRKRVADACGAFHRYQVLWTPDSINFGVDDVGYYAFRNDGRGDPATWPFDQPFYAILNLAVGGDWGGVEGVDRRAFPQTLEVDYVRVFQKVEP